MQSPDLARLKAETIGFCGSRRAYLTTYNEVVDFSDGDRVKLATMATDSSLPSIVRVVALIAFHEE